MPWSSSRYTRTASRPNRGRTKASRRTPPPTHPNRRPHPQSPRGVGTRATSPGTKSGEPGAQSGKTGAQSVLFGQKNRNRHHRCPTYSIRNEPFQNEKRTAGKNIGSAGYPTNGTRSRVVAVETGPLNSAFFFQTKSHQHVNVGDIIYVNFRPSVLAFRAIFRKTYQCPAESHGLATAAHLSKSPGCSPSRHNVVLAF